MTNNTNFERIAQFLKDEGEPRTPNEISVWTGIRLNCVYYTLQNNKVFFREIIVDNSLKGWIVENPYF